MRFWLPKQNTHARQQQLRLRDEERRAKVAYAQHMEAVAAERNNKRVQEKMDRAKQMEAEREQVLAEMGRLRQEMSMQEDMYRETLHNMKVWSRVRRRAAIRGAADGCGDGVVMEITLAAMPMTVVVMAVVVTRRKMAMMVAAVVLAVFMGLVMTIMKMAMTATMMMVMGW